MNEFEKAFKETTRLWTGREYAMWAAKWAFKRAAEIAKTVRAAESPDEFLPIEIAEEINEECKRLFGE